MARPPPGGHDLVEQVAPRAAPMSDANVADVGPDPAGPIDDGRALDDARQLGPERRRQARHDPGHRLARRRPRRPAARPAVSVPGRARAAGRSRSARRPASRRGPARADALRAPAEDGRRGAERRADEEAGLPDPVVAPRPARPLPAAARGHAATATPSSTGSTSGNAAPNEPTASARNAPTSPVVSWRWVAVAVVVWRSWPAAPASAAVPRVVPGASRPLIASSSTSADAVAVAESTIATRVPRDRGDDRPRAAGSGCSRGAACRSGRRGRQREDELAGRVALAEQRRQRVGDGRLDLGPGSSPASTSGTSAGVACS